MIKYEIKKQKIKLKSLVISCLYNVNLIKKKYINHIKKELYEFIKNKIIKYK